MSDRTYDLVYNCGPVSKKFHADIHSRVKLLIGPFGTGKTSSAAFDIVECQSKRVISINGIQKSRFAVVRNTYPELRDTTIKTYLDWFPDTVFGKYNQTEKIYRIVFDGREIEIIFKALDTPKDVRDLLSLELTGAHVDECREIHQDVIKGLLGRVGRYPSMKDTGGVNPFINPPQISLTTNYPSREHYLYRDFVENPIEGYAIYEQDQQENKHNLRPGYYEDLENDYENRPDLLKTLVRGEWGVTVRGKQVYPEFNRHFHVSSSPLLPIAKDGAKMGRSVVRGWDNTGLHPACLITYPNTLGQWFWVKEFCAEDSRITDFAQAVNLWCQEHFHVGTDYVDIGDPAGRNRDSLKGSPASYIEEELGISIQDGPTQNLKVRRESVAKMLNKQVQGMPALVIDPSCTRVIDGFEGGYAYPEISNTGVFRTEPEKNQYSDIHDAGQYIATVLFPPGPIDEEYDNPRKDYQERNQTTGY